MRQSELTERLDQRGLLADARGPGCYAVECAVPDLYADVQEAWANTQAVDAPEDTLERLTGAKRVCYIGASGNVYERLCDHLDGTREASFVATYPPTRVLEVWPSDTPFDDEYNRAMEMVDQDWCVWMDGELYG